MVYFNDRTFAAGRVPLQRPLEQIYAFPIPTMQTPEPSPPAEPVEVPDFAKNGTVFDMYNPFSNSFAPTANGAVMDQMRQQTAHEYENKGTDRPGPVEHTQPPSGTRVDQGRPSLYMKPRGRRTLMKGKEPSINTEVPLLLE